MDSTTCTLFFALFAALCAAVISGWLLFLMVQPGVFWLVMFAILAAAPAGLFLPWYCGSGRRHGSIVPTMNILGAAALSVFLGSALVIAHDRVSQPGSDPETRLLDEEFLRTIVAIAGLGTASALVVFLLHIAVVEEAPRLRRAWRRVLRYRWWAPKARIVICDDFAAAAKGECAICLDALDGRDEQEGESCQGVAGAAVDNSLLQLPCGHKFHSKCADRWMEREANCPMCRRSIGSLSQCVRLVPQGPPAAAGAEAAADAGCTVATDAAAEAAGDEKIEVEDCGSDCEAGDHFDGVAPAPIPVCVAPTLLSEGTASARAR